MGTRDDDLKHDGAPASSRPPLRDASGKWLPGATGNAGGLPRAVRQVRALAASVSPTAVAALAAMLEHPDWRARHAAACALMDRGGISPMTKAPDEGLSEADLAIDVTGKALVTKAVKAMSSEALAKIVQGYREPDPTPSTYEQERDSVEESRIRQQRIPSPNDAKLHEE